jgi:hypothetical protein
VSRHPKRDESDEQYRPSPHLSTMTREVPSALQRCTAPSKQTRVFGAHTIGAHFAATHASDAAHVSMMTEL